MTATKAGVEESIRVRGFDDLTVTAKRADVIGTNRANHIIVIACRTTIKGMKGRDGSSVELSTDTYGGGLLVPRCSNYEATIDGGPGNDFIQGSTGNDRLIGGPGNDAIIGRGGDDRLIGGPGRDSVRVGKGATCARARRFGTARSASDRASSASRVPRSGLGGSRAVPSPGRPGVPSAV